MKLELIDEEWRRGYSADPRAPREGKSPDLVDVRTIEDAEAALQERNRVSTLVLLDRYKMRMIRRLLKAADAAGWDGLEVAFFLGVSETCVRKWRRQIANSDSWPPVEVKK